jgi:hypothetical protein
MAGKEISLGEGGIKGDVGSKTTYDKNPLAYLILVVYSFNNPICLIIVLISCFGTNVPLYALCLAPLI